MNLIFVMMDGARLDRIRKGKNYQKIISKSAFFPKCITYAPYTIAAMHAVFSGTYGHKNGVNSYYSSPHFKKEEYKSLTKYLKNNGYYTYADVINKLVIPKNDFDEFVVHDEINDDLTKRHTSLISNMNDRKKNDEKFFLYLHYSNIHTGIMQEVLKKYDNFSEEYFANRKKNEEFYDELFSNADKYLGKIIDHCEDLGILEDTLLVIISDHGISVGEKMGERAYGVFCYDYTLNATALFHNKTISSIDYKKQIRSIDILPTILDLLSIPIDSSYKPIDGKTVTSLINGDTDSRIAFSQSGNPLNEERPPKEPNVWAIRTDEWKYIKNIHNNSEELYDLQKDPDEENNVINIKKEVATNLREQMSKISNI